jgi:hypothetical protein
MKRRKQIGKLIYTPRWGQGDVKLSEDYEGLSRDEKLDVLSHWISEFLSIRNAMISNPQSRHHFMGDKSWYGLTDEEQQELYDQWQDDGWGSFYKAIEAKLKEKNT